MALKVPEMVGDPRPLTMVTPAQLEVIRAVAADPTRIAELKALIPHLKTFVHGRGMISQDFRFPDGSLRTWGLWHSPDERTPSARVTIMFPLTKNGEVVALRQWRPAAAFSAPEECFITELPGGNAKKGTTPTPEEVADAELAEETGYGAREWQRTSPKQTWWEPTNLTPRYTPVVGLDCEWVKQPNLDETELIEILVVPLAELIEMIRRGEVCDNKSITGTFLALLRLGMIELKLS